MERTSKRNVGLSWLLIVLVLLFQCSVLVAPAAAAPGSSAIHLKVVAEFVTVREGRGDGTPLVAQVVQGAEVSVIGGPTGGWWQVQLTDGRQGWVNGDAASVQALDAEGLAVQTAPAASETLTGTLVFQASSGGAIYTIDAALSGTSGQAGANLHYLTNGLDPALSPDGQWVAFARWDTGSAGLYIIKVDGTGERLLLSESMVKAPAWSPDGTEIAISYQHGGHVGDWTATLTMTMPGKDGESATTRTVERSMPADARWKIAVVRVSDGLLSDMYCHDYSYSPTWSADGTKIAYASDKGISLTWDGITAAATRDPNSYAVSTFSFVDRSPAWSPDGARIAFQYKTSSHSEIFVMNADGSGRAALTQSPPLAETAVSSVSPAWSPDGSHIAYLSNPDGVWNIWVMDADGGNARPMFEAGTLKGIEFEYNNVDERVLSWS